MEQLEIMFDLKQGGEWLVAARVWMQSNIKDGDTLCWSDGTLISTPFCKLEEFALKVAIAAVAEDRKKRK